MKTYGSRVICIELSLKYGKRNLTNDCLSKHDYGHDDDGEQRTNTGTLMDCYLSIHEINQLVFFLIFKSFQSLLKYNIKIQSEKRTYKSRQEKEMARRQVSYHSISPQE